MAITVICSISLVVVVSHLLTSRQCILDHSFLWEREIPWWWWWCGQKKWPQNEPFRLKHANSQQNSSAAAQMSKRCNFDRFFSFLEFRTIKHQVSHSTVEYYAWIKIYRLGCQYYVRLLKGNTHMQGEGVCSANLHFYFSANRVRKQLLYFARGNAVSWNDGGNDPFVLQLSSSFFQPKVSF